ncbi:MAG: undecaprenyl/decaprenyl-phosphate alpha-N-acetylglucosaminyl 1-phosphate transferase [Magnetococcales bacterium]|nr:undecaprenyl/decaprenyl-phosphate alpha-N-acetylglucosaminyl 1-phosphate transferase [Magnetococcales bacterium]
MDISKLPLLEVTIALCGSLFWILFGTVVAPKLGLVDRPSDRKKHGKDTPNSGGVAMLLGLIPALLLLDHPIPFQSRLVLATLLTLVVGVWDDRSPLPVRTRFLAELAAGLIVTLGGGLTVLTLGNLVGLGEVNLGFLAVPFTVICIIGVINALNMIDGLDGLAAGLSLVSFSALFYLAWEANRVAEAEMILLIIAVLIPFFLVNSRLFGQSSARLFMGDAGSKMLGLSLAWFTVSLSQTLVLEDAEVIQPAFSASVALWLVALPLIDMFSSFLRRLVQKSNPFKPDANHLHHLLLQSGLSVNQTVLTLMGVGVGCALVGVKAEGMRLSEPLLFLGLLVLYAAYSTLSVRFWRRQRSLQ